MLRNDTTVNFYIKDNNVGDQRCSPLQYFDIPAIESHFDDFKLYSPNTNIIIGGGMLLKRTSDTKILDYFTAIKIGWGVGHKTKESYALEPFVKQFDLLGVRDYGIGLRYVPCVSCMSRLFDIEYTIVRDVVYYENSRSCRLSRKPLMGNTNSFENVIEFLASAETIVSSSYHGVYWGKLLGRKVIAIPFNYKFNHFKYKIPLETELSVTPSKIQHAPRFIGFLEECRILNIEFAQHVTRLLN